jgi:hypothetical protein
VIAKGNAEDCFGRIAFAFEDQVVCGRGAEAFYVWGELCDGLLDDCRVEYRGDVGFCRHFTIATDESRLY